MSQVLQVNGNYLVKVSDSGNITLDTGNKVGDVIVTGNLIVDNNVTINGSLILGDSGDDTIIAVGELSSDIKPKVGGIYDLGSSEKHWRSLYVGQILPQGYPDDSNTVQIKGLAEPVEAQDAATKNYVDTTLGRVANVFYVAISGDDLFDGKSLAKAKRTIKAAVEAAKQEPNGGYDVTIFVKSGDYVEDNPIRLPEKLAIWGDNLRSTTVRPQNKTQDLFWVTNGNYISQMTFKDHEFPAAAVAFPPPTLEYPAVAIHTSPYVQNCTSITTTGCGMRVDGSYVKGLKSMVLDAYTQYNQGGIGIHMLNRGNTQLVSAFTINCDIAILCTNGGFCSLTNSNSSFGNYGLVADGVSEPLYSGELTGNINGIIGDVVTINNLTQRPNIGDAIRFGNSTSYYTVSTADALSAGEIQLVGPSIEGQPSDARALRQLVLSEKDKIAIDTIDYLNETYKDLDYNQFKCTRDTNLIVEATLDDMILGTNYKSIQAGMAYSRLSANVVRDEQLVESLAALDFTKTQVLNVMSSDSSTEQPEYSIVENNFDLIYNLFEAASSINPPTPPAYVWTPPVGASAGVVNAKDIIIANRDFLIEETIAFIEANLTFTYNKELCQRDIGLIIDAIGYDLMFGSNFRSITAGRAYYRGVTSAQTVTTTQKTATLDAFNHLKLLLQQYVVTNVAAYESITTNMDLIIDILDQGLTAVPPTYTIPNPSVYDTGFEYGRNLIELNRDFIKAEVIQYITNNYPAPGFTYDQTACERDIDLVLDAVYYDMTYQGNLESLIAGRAYFSSGTLVNSSEKTETLAAYAFLRDLLEDVSQGIDVSELQSVVSQVIEINVGSPTAGAFANSLIEDIRTIINESPDPAIVYPDTSWVDTSYLSFHETFQDEKDNIANSVTNYIDARYFLLDYDRSTCQRDIGLIVDALAYDYMFGSNFRTITAGRAYTRATANVVSTVQKSATIDAFNKLKTIVTTIVESAGDPLAPGILGNLMDIILDILAGGLSNVPSYVIPNPVGYDTGFLYARELIEANRDFITAEVIQYIANNYPSPGFTYDQAACERDIELILDALYYDITYRSNVETLIAGKAYYSFGSIVNPGEETETLAAYAFMRDLVEDVAQGIDVTELQVIVPQVFDSNVGSSTAATFANNRIEDIRTIISTPESEPSTILPDITWVDPVAQSVAGFLLFQKENIKSQVTDYIDENYNTNRIPFAYDSEKCRRDVGLIVDALGFDLMFNSNARSITAGRAYYRANASLVLESQKTATIEALEVLKEFLSTVLVGEVEATRSIEENIDLIINIVDQGLSAVPEFIRPEPVGYDDQLRRARNQIENNRTFIKAELVKYIEINYPSIYDSFDQSKCERDIDYILDAVYYDLTYSGNMETAIAANSYYVGTESQIPGEETATLAAYNYLKSLVSDIAQGISVSALQVDVTQVFGNASGAGAATIASNLIEDIRTVISTSTLITNPTLANYAWVQSSVVDLYNLLQTQKENAKISVIDYIDSKYFLLTYNRDKCKRDVGYIIDAVGYDVKFGSNFRSITAARSYYRANASVVTSNQKSATIGALRRLKELFMASSGGDPQVDARIESLMEMMVDIINRGPVLAVPGYVIPSPTGYDTGYENARNLISANRDFIKAEVIQYITNNYPAPGFTYDQTACERDIDYILDAIYYDMTYRGNLESLVAGNAYYVGTNIVNPGEKTETISTYGFMKTLIENISLNVNVSELQLSEPQVFGTAGSSDASIFAGSLVQNVIDIIDNPLNPPSEVIPDDSWVDSSYITFNLAIQNNKEDIKTAIQIYIDTKYSYNQTTCRRDTGFILDAMIYDVLYGGNSQTFAAAESYYGAGIFRIGGRERLMTVNSFKYLKSVVGSCLLNIPVTPINTVLTQDTSNPSATFEEVVKTNELFSIVAEVVENGFTSTISLNETIPDFDPLYPGDTVTFHQFSLITASGHTFEWVGAGTNVNTSLPYLGGVPISENKAIETNGGKVYWTGTDQYGDFNIGGELIIRRDSGTIEGRTFTKSLFAVLTPYILAVGE